MKDLRDLKDWTIHDVKPMSQKPLLLPARPRIAAIPPRRRANVEHIRQSRPNSGLNFQTNVLLTFQVVPSSFGSGGETLIGRDIPGGKGKFLRVFITANTARHYVCTHPHRGCVCPSAISSGSVFVTGIRAQWKLLHTWIILVIVKQNLVHIGRIDGPIINTRRDYIATGGVHCPGLVFKAHRLVFHSTLGSKVIKKKYTLSSPLRRNTSPESYITK